MNKTAQHILKNIRFDLSTFFFPAFIAVLCCISYFQNFSFDLNSKYNGIIGWTSMENFDTNARLKLYSNCLLIGTLVFLFSVYSINLLKHKFLFIRPELKLLNFVGLFGLIVSVYYLFSPEQMFGFRFLFGVSFFVLIGILFHILFRKKYRNAFNHSEFTVWSLITGFLIYIILDYFSLLLSDKHLNPLTENIFYIAGGVFIISQCLFLFTGITFAHLKKHLVFIVWFALHTVISNEVVFSLNQHQIFCDPLLILLSGFIIILLVTYFFILKDRKKTLNHCFTDLQKLYFPLTLCIVVLHGYFQLYLPNPHELFETANPANAMMRTFVFHQIPFLDYMNSHLLSESIFGFLYVGLNGYSGTMDFSVYDYFFNVVYILIAYYWIRKISGDGAFAFGFALFFPFLIVIFGGLFCLVFISLFLLRKAFLYPTTKNFLLNFFWLFFLLFWRLDAGFSNLTAQALLLLMCFIKYPLSRKPLIKALGIFLSACGLLLLIAWLLQHDLFVNIKQALHYFKANQAFGYFSIGDSSNRLFVIQYFLFPALIMIIAIWAFIKLNSIKLKQSFVWVNILFFAVFYLSNYQRGVVCHGFNNNTDSYLTSFSFLIFGLLALLWAQHKDKTTQKIVFISTVFVLVLVLKFPDCKGYITESDQFYASYAHYKPYKNTPDKIIRYVPDKAFEKENYYDLNDFLKKNFSVDATFIDMSNTPMLYFYTQRCVPSYFNQYMQNTVDEYLQTENLKKLQKTDVPVVVYSNVPKTWFDCTDGVENSLRYDLIAEHIFLNYHPFILLSKHSIWLKNGLNLPLGTYQADTLSGKPQLTELNKLAWLEGQRAARYDLPAWYSWNDSDIHTSGKHFELILPRIVLANYFEFVLTNHCNAETKATLVLYTDSTRVGAFRFTVMNKPDAQKYRIRLSTQYAWFAKHPNRIELSFDDESCVPEIRSAKLLKAETP